MVETWLLLVTRSQIHIIKIRTKTILKQGVMYLRIFHLIYGASSNCHIEREMLCEETLLQRIKEGRKKERNPLQ